MASNNWTHKHYADIGNYSTYLLLHITMKFKYWAYLANHLLWNYAGNQSWEQHIDLLSFPNEKALPYIKLLVTSIRPCQINIKNTDSSTLSQVAMSAGLFAFRWNLQEKSWRTPVLWDVCIDLKGWKAGHYLFRWKNTKLCMLCSSDQTKKIPKNVLHVWLSEFKCCISNIKWWGRNITIVKAVTITFIINFQK